MYPCSHPHFLIDPLFFSTRAIKETYIYTDVLYHVQGFELIPSENFTSLSVMQAVGSVMNNKYIEGYPGARFYGGNEYENSSLILLIFPFNVQSLSRSPANFQVYTVLLKPHERIMALGLPHGGHLSHGYQTMPYRLDEGTDYVDCDQMEKSVVLFRPKLIVAGANAYARVYDYARMRKSLMGKGYDLVSDGTDNHLVLGIDGSRVEKVMELVHISANINTVPGDVYAMVPGGIRMGKFHSL
ncbi:hypothetical protein L1887_01600 [Cichorium endivia]|nr:hypothetical protein L1887_01600 [Cichorium endivia]